MSDKLDTMVTTRLSSGLKVSVLENELEALNRYARENDLRLERILDHDCGRYDSLPTLWFISCPDLELTRRLEREIFSLTGVIHVAICVADND